MGFAVRRATTDDIEQMLDVYESVAAEGRWIGGELPIDRVERAKRWTESMESGDVTMFAADVDGRIVGTLSGYPHRGVVDLGMAIIDGHRGRGIGSALLQACIDWARGEGSHKITLQVWPHNERAIGLYDKFGFEREGYLKRHHKRRNGELWDAIMMALLLEPWCPHPADTTIQQGPKRKR